jgi:hypothetical protein
VSKHTPGPWTMSRPMGTGHLEGREPWFWVSADRTLHLQVTACPDGFVAGENEANARLIAAAPELLEALQLALSAHGRMLLSDPPQDAWKAYGVEEKARAAIIKATEVKP